MRLRPSFFPNDLRSHNISEIKQVRAASFELDDVKLPGWRDGREWDTAAKSLLGSRGLRLRLM
jgi:hypothetical protein